MASIYLDASFISACVTDRTDAKSIARKESSQEWWASQRSAHELYVSNEIHHELSSPGFGRRDQALTLIAAVPSLEVNQEVTGVAQIFVEEYLMPGPAVGDALHVAISAVYGIDYLLSWNIRHLANPNKIKHLQVVCRRLGLIPPQIVTPEFIWEY